jgi:hypothetical protein
VTLFRLEGMVEHRVLNVMISSRVAEWQVSSLAQFCSSSFPPFSKLERLSINTYMFKGLNEGWADGMESCQWLELLRPFVAVRDLVLPAEFGVASQVATALQELTGSAVTEVLPALGRVFVHHVDVDHIQRIFALFITARQLSGHPISVHPQVMGAGRSW